MEEIRYGVIGCGGHAIDAHSVHNKEVPGFELTAVCDLKNENAHAYCDAYEKKVPVYQDYRDMLVNEDLHAILIMSRDEDHPEQLEAAVNQGLHVMVEKPLAIDRDGMTRVSYALRDAREKKLVVTSCHPRRFDPPFIWLKENLPTISNNLGAVNGFYFDFAYSKPKAEWKFWRSLMLDHLGHEIDLVSFLFGRHPFTAKLYGDDFDRYNVTGKRDNFHFAFYGMRRLDERGFHEWATVEFERGSVVVNTVKGIATVISRPDRDRQDVDCGATDYRKRSVGIIQNFTNAIRGTAKNYLDQEDLLLNNSFGIQLRETGSFEYM